MNRTFTIPDIGMTMAQWELIEPTFRKMFGSTGHYFVELNAKDSLAFICTFSDEYNEAVEKQMIAESLINGVFIGMHLMLKVLDEVSLNK